MTVQRRENKKSFFARIKPRVAPSELVAIQGAYYLAKYAHRAQTRKETDKEGNPLRYFEHVRRVALILMDDAHIYNPELIITCLLHDAVEDTEDLTIEVIEHFFGAGVARRVQCLTKDPDNKEGYLQQLRHADPYTVVCKMCDRLDNLRSLKDTTKAFQKKQAKETFEKYIELFDSAIKKLPRNKALWEVWGEVHDIAMDFK